MAQRVFAIQMATLATLLVNLSHLFFVGLPLVAGAQCKGSDIAKRVEIPTYGGWDGDPAGSIHGAPRGAKWHFQFGSECTDLSLAYLNLKDEGCQDLAHALTSEMAMQVEVINLRYNDIGPGFVPPYYLLKRELN
jgi:hypothetical protein